MTTVVTNVVIALMITTTTPRAIPCPDNLPTCLVHHFTNETTRVFTNVKVFDYNDTDKGVAFNSVVVDNIIHSLFGKRKDVPSLIPIKIYNYTSDGNRNFPSGAHAVGVLFRDILFKETERCIKAER